MSSVFVRYPYMAINDIVQDTNGFLSYILLFTQAPILVWLDGTTIDIISIILVTTRYVLKWLCWVMIGGCAW